MSFDQAQWDRAFGMLGKRRTTKKESRLQHEVVNFLLVKYPKVRFASSLTGENQSNQMTRFRNNQIQHSKGHPDLLIYKKSGPYCGLALELKREGESPFRKDGKIRAGEHLANQNKWLKYLRKQGWAAFFSTGLNESCDIIEWYLEKNFEKFDSISV